MAETFPQEALEATVRRHFPDAGELRFRPPGGGKHNTSFVVEGASRPLVLRISPPPTTGSDARFLFYERRMMRQEPALHELLRGRTRAPVAEVIAHAFDDPTLGRDYLVLERLPGRMLGEAGDPGRTLRELGACLREVHAIRGERFGYDGAHRPMEPRESWRDAFHVMWNLLLDDIESVGGYRPDEAAGMRRLLEAHAAVFDHPVEPCLLHMDVWAENILAAPDGRLAGLLDWDRALWGDPEIEYAVLDYCGISRPPFWEGYGTGTDPRAGDPLAQLRGVFYFLYELQKYIFIRLARRDDPVAAESYRRESLRIARQLEAAG